METDDATDMDRNRSQKHTVEPEVMAQMVMQRGVFRPKKGYVRCDIDGTLADIAHRRHFLQTDPQNWQSFFAALGQDTPREVTPQRLATIFHGTVS